MLRAIVSTHKLLKRNKIWEKNIQLKYKNQNNINVKICDLYLTILDRDDLRTESTSPDTVLFIGQMLTSQTMTQSLRVGS